MKAPIDTTQFGLYRDRASLLACACSCQPYDKIDINAPFSVAFEAVGWKWAKYVAAGALKGMTFVLLVGAVGQARGKPGSIHMTPQWLTIMDAKTGTPVNSHMEWGSLRPILGLSEDGWIGYCITVPIWAAVMVSLWAFMPQAHEPKMRAVPLV
ncbi:hypothetical protein Tco_1373722, partial [Tanacetum coccineum]